LRQVAIVCRRRKGSRPGRTQNGRLSIGLPAKGGH